MEIANVDALIHVIRGQRVMLDRDLSELYGVPTKKLNQAVKRHANRFPVDFMFKLNLQEAARLRSQSVISKSELLRSQIVTSNKRSGGQRYLSNVFTEQGVAMLSSVLNSERAVEINIAIMRAFVKLRQAVLFDASLAVRMEKAEQAVAIHEVLAAFRRLKPPH